MSGLKKDLIFVIPMFVISILLILLKVTGMTVHIILSVLGVAILVVYAVMTKKDWKLPVLEIVMRAFYAVALITGIIIMNVHGVLALSIIHKISAMLSIISIIVLFVHKIVVSKKA